MQNRYSVILGAFVVLQLLSVDCFGAAAAAASPPPAQRAAYSEPGSVDAVALGSLVFNALATNNVKAILDLLQTPPYDVVFMRRGQEKKVTVGVNEYRQLRSSLEYGFTAIIEAFRADGVTLAKTRLDKITAEYDSSNDFRIVEIYLTIHTDRGKYRVRVEDCFKAGDKYFIENLKWVGKEE